MKYLLKVLHHATAEITYMVVCACALFLAGFTVGQNYLRREAIAANAGHYEVISGQRTFKWGGGWYIVSHDPTAGTYTVTNDLSRGAK